MWVGQLGTRLGHTMNPVRFPLGMSGFSSVRATEEVETVTMVTTGGPGGASKVETDMLTGKPKPH